MAPTGSLPGSGSLIGAPVDGSVRVIRTYLIGPVTLSDPMNVCCTGAATTMTHGPLFGNEFPHGSPVDGRVPQPDPDRERIAFERSRSTGCSARRGCPGRSQPVGEREVRGLYPNGTARSFRRPPPGRPRRRARPSTCAFTRHRAGGGRRVEVAVVQPVGGEPDALELRGLGDGRAPVGVTATNASGAFVVCVAPDPVA